MEKREHALSAARFTDDVEHPAFVGIEGHAVHGAGDAVRRFEVRLEQSNLKDGHGSFMPGTAA